MTTPRQRKVKAFLRPLLDRHPELVLTRPDVMTLLPVHHVARQIWVRDANRKTYFLLEWRLTDLFLPEPIQARPWWGFGWCYEWIGRSTRYRPQGQGGLWEWDDPTMAGDFIDQVETLILPALRALDTLDKSIAFATEHEEAFWNAERRWRAIAEIAMGDVAAAQRRWPEIKRRFPEGRVIPDFPRYDQLIHGRYRDLEGPLMADDRPALARLLHAWEAENVADSRLAPHWQPTPFPLERAA